jgi:hypothetical protein
LDAREQASRYIGLATRTASMAIVAKSLGVSKARVSHWASPKHQSDIVYGDILAMPPRIGLVALRAGVALLEERERAESGQSIESDSVDAQAREATIALGKVMEQLHFALADGVIDPSEAAAILRGTQEQRRRIDAFDRGVIAAANASDGPCQVAAKYFAATSAKSGPDSRSRARGDA